MAESSGGNCGCGGILLLVAIVLTILKLTGVVQFSWVWILSPIWIPILIIALGTVFGLGIIKALR